MIQVSKRKSIVRSAIATTLFICVLTGFHSTSLAQIRPVYDQGALGLAQLLKRLNTTASVLMIGAHPDDEDTALLAYLARGESARTAYLSLTRGDGGQNLIGPELGEALGVIRTEELLQARKLDGAEQFFTRAYDYGFSKTLAEAKEKWDEKVILCDVVRVIRTFQPLVVVSQFSGTPVDGHGQHQYAGYISPLAVKAAADPVQCKESGGAWAVKKFYVRHRGAGEPTLKINTGNYDPLLGRSYFEIAMQARSQHRSQEQGVLELKGDQFSGLDLVSVSAPRVEREPGVFDGLDVSVPEAEEVLAKYDPFNPTAVIPALIRIHSQSKDAYPVQVASEALLRATGTRIDVLADRETVVAGDSVPVTVRVFSPYRDLGLYHEVDFNFPHVELEAPKANPQSGIRTESAKYAEFYQLTVPDDALPSQPFWLRVPRQNDMFTVSHWPSAIFESRSVIAALRLFVAGEQLEVLRPVEYRYADDIRGEVRRELSIVPKVVVEFDRELLIVPTNLRRSQRDVFVNLTTNTSGPMRGRIRLNVPSGWKAVPGEANFTMNRRGEKVSVRFSIDIPVGSPPQSYQIKAEALVGDETFAQTMQTLAYEHIQTHRIYRPAKVDVKLIDLQVAPVRVGYIRGSGDRVYEAIQQLGLEIEEVDERTLASGDLSKFDTIVVGIRAYQVRPDLVSNNRRLIDFAEKGGTLIVQYQLPQTYSQQNLTPFPAQQGPRVVDENAPVKILQPTHPIFNFPNKITSADFEGWVQERNLYNFSTMDPKYVGLLESHDAGEPENKGGLVVADIGKGKYIYCSYSLFRQLPAGVPGAYRLLANLLNSGKTPSAGRGK